MTEDLPARLLTAIADPVFDHTACTCTHGAFFHDTTGCRAALTDTVPTHECPCTATWSKP